MQIAKNTPAKTLPFIPRHQGAGACAANHGFSRIGKYVPQANSLCYKGYVPQANSLCYKGYVPQETNGFLCYSRYVPQETNGFLCYRTQANSLCYRAAFLFMAC